jgi:hypothetical protein
MRLIATFIASQSLRLYNTPAGARFQNDASTRIASGNMSGECIRKIETFQPIFDASRGEDLKAALRSM